MKYKKLLESPEVEGTYNTDRDERVLQLDDTRKPQLTLRHLNALRKYKAFKRNELNTKKKVVAIVYGTEDTGEEM